jgi:hypothetical protein
VRLRRRRGVLADDVGLDDVIEQVSELVRLVPGHPLRSQRCILCGTLIGGQLARMATLVDMRDGGCSCGAVSTITMLLCESHGLAEDVDWLETLTGRWLLHHGKVTA